MGCETNVCGVGGWTGPLPGDPDNSATLSAVSVFGGVEVSWSMPVTNTHAVAHTLLHRGTSNVFGAASVIATVAGDRFFDRSPPSTTILYYYWIRFVSVHGTFGDPIGPASATAKPRIQEMIEDLSGKIDAGLLAATLRTDIDGIGVVADALSKEAADRIASNDILREGYEAAITGNVEAKTFVQQEVVARTTANSAFVTQLNNISAAVGQSFAAITSEVTARVNAVSSLASIVTNTFATYAGNFALIAQDKIAFTNATEALGRDVSSINSKLINLTDKDIVLDSGIKNENFARTTNEGIAAGKFIDLYARSGSNLAAISDIESTKIGYAVLAGTSTPFDGDGSTIVYPSGTYSAILFPAYAANRTRIIDKTGVNLWNGTLAGSSNPLTWVQGLPLATAIKRIGVTGPNGEGTTLEQSFTSQKTLNDGFKSLYTLKVSTTVGGQKVIGGFGLYGDATGVEAGFDVDRFWIGRSDSVTKTYPFIISGGIVYIKEAAIQTLNFNKLRSDDGNLVFESGKLRATHINVEKLTGGSFTAYAWPAAGQSGFYLGPGGFAMGNYNTLPGTVAQYFSVNTSGDLIMPGLTCSNGKLTINELNVIGTANIAGNAVTIPTGATAGLDGASAVVVKNTTEHVVVTAPSINTGGKPIFVDVSFDLLLICAAAQAMNLTMRLKVFNGTTTSVVKTYVYTRPTPNGRYQYPRADGVYIANPEDKNLVFSLTIQCNVVPLLTNEVELVIGTLGIIGMKR